MENNTAFTPDLRPRDFIEDGVYGRTPEGHIYYEALHTCRGTLSAMLAESDFDHRLVPERMRSDLEDLGVASIVSSALREHINWGYRGELLLDAYEIERPDSDTGLSQRWQGPIHAPYPESFAQDMLEQVENLDVDMSDLQHMSDVYQETRIPEFLELVHRQLTRNKEEDANLADEIFEMVEKAVFDSEFTLPLEEDDTTYLICFVNFLARQLFKNVMIANQVKQRMDIELGELEGEGDKTAYDALLQIMRAEALTGQDWDNFSLRHGVSEDTRIRAALQAASLMEAQAALQAMRDQGEGLDVIQAFTNAQQGLKVGLKNIAEVHSRGLQAFANTDIGHGMRGFDIHGADDIIRENTVQSEAVNIQKDGTTALIFEDDRQQADVWRDLVNRFSASVVSEEGVTEDAEVFYGEMEDPNIGLFIIDINNDVDEMAGVEVADKLTRLKLGQVSSGVINADRVVKIIVWSASPELVKKASNHFRPKIDEDEGEFNSVGGYRLEGSSRPASRGVELVVKHKDPSLRDFNNQERVPERYS